MNAQNGYALVRNRNEVYDVNGLVWTSMTQPGGSTGGAGDASAANQATGNASLASIDTKLTSPVTIAHANLDATLSSIATEATALLIKSQVGGLTETAPSTDIASAGLNGRLQRIAQRLSSLIGLLPTALTGNNALRVEQIVAGPTQPVSGTVTTSRPTTATRTSVLSANQDTALLAANASRYGATIHNDADKTLYLALGTTAASTTNFTCKVLAGGYYETPFFYTGAVRGFWDTTPTGSARISEIA